MTQEAIEAKKDLHHLTIEIIRLRQKLDHENEDRDQLLTRLYGLEKDAAALRRSLQTDQAVAHSPVYGYLLRGALLGGSPPA